MSELLMQVTSSKLLAEDLRPSILYIYDDKLVFESNVGVIGGEEAVINYDQIAEVDQEKGVFASTLTIVNKGGANDITIEHVTNAEAESAKNLIEDQARKWSEQNRPDSTTPNTSIQEG